MINAFIINKYQPIREAFRRVLEGDELIHVSQEATSFSQAKKILNKSYHDIDVVILDTYAGDCGRSSMILVRYILNQFPGMKILVFGFEKIGAFIYQLYQEGVHGFLLKRSSSSEILRAIHSIYLGNYYYEGQVKILLNQYVKILKNSTESGITISHKEKSLLQELIMIYHAGESYLIEGAAGQREFMTWASLVKKLGTQNLEEIFERSIEQGLISGT